VTGVVLDGWRLGGGPPKVEINRLATLSVPGLVLDGWRLSGSVPRNGDIPFCDTLRAGLGARRVEIKRQRTSEVEINL
jgi:hypothetical protein